MTVLIKSNLYIMTSMIQSVRFDKKNYTKKQADSWMKYFKLKETDFFISAHSIRYYLKDPNEFNRFETEIAGPGILLVVGYYNLY